ncbi:MAG TPA: hypothetical protein VLA93_22350 [Pyrinomonadaceae bacterium]|nr:hypothetical protein [Pyrinomonadaceae bacterium]
MKSPKPTICASVLVLVLSTSAMAGNIGGMKTTSAGNIGGLKTNSAGNIGGLRTSRTGNIGGLRSNDNIGGLNTNDSDPTYRFDRYASFSDLLSILLSVF